MSRWHAIIFDLDDTLYPEQAYVLSGFRAVAQWAAVHLDIPAVQGYAELHQLFQQGVRGDTFNRWLHLHSLDADALVPQLVQVYREHTPLLEPFPEIPALLDRLCNTCRLGLVSDGYLAVQQRKFAALGLGHAFQAVVFSDQWGRQAWKPSVQPFQAVVQQLRIAPDQAVYIADNPTKDFLGARQIGMATIRVQWVGGEYAHLVPPTPAHAPDITLTTPDELATVLVT
ncbi:MAG: HAD family hydrolase [Chloroflexaceae bacterium]|nr:HAD family hydrolase [Chloroflexaceae bacterium]